LNEHNHQFLQFLGLSAINSCNKAAVIGFEEVRAYTKILELL